MRVTCVIALLMLCLSGATLRAQPPEQATVDKGRSKPIDGTTQMAERLARAMPEVMATFIVKRFSRGDLQMAAFGVAGSDPNSPELAQLSQALSLSSDHTDWDADFDEEKLATMPAGAAEIVVSVRVGMRDAFAMQLRREEKVALRVEMVGGKKIWRVVPAKPEEVFTPAMGDSPDIGIVRRIATYLAYPKQALMWLGLGLGQMQAKQLSLAVMQYVQNQDEKFQFDIDNFKHKIRPYLRDEALFTAPGDVPGRQSFHFNPYLTGKKLADVEEAAQTVMLSLGTKDNLNFLYGGRTIIVFTDGHSEAIDVERSKTLRWKP